MVSSGAGLRSERPVGRSALRRCLSKADGQGQWWKGLDPQDYYAQYHALGRYDWPQSGNPPLAKPYIEKFFRRTIDLIDKYNPDLLYFDDTVLPIYPASDIGLRIAAYYYNTSLARHGGKLEAVLTGKGLNAEQRRALVLDVRARRHQWRRNSAVADRHLHRLLAL